jgi:hypothetical protein
MIRPVVRRRPRPQRVLQLAVAPFHHAVAAGVEGGGSDVLDMQPAAQSLPDRRCELGAAVGGDDRRHPEAADPAGDQSVRYSRCLHVLDRNGFHPSCRLINDGEEVLEPHRGSGERPHQIHMQVCEPPLRYGDALCRRRRLPRDLPPLAGLTIAAPPGCVGGAPAPHKPARNQASRGSDTWVRQPMDGGEHRRSEGGRATPVNTSHRTSAPWICSRRTCRSGLATAFCTSGQDPCTAAIAA